jgi:hypothetical protein
VAAAQFVPVKHSSPALQLACAAHGLDSVLDPPEPPLPTLVPAEPPPTPLLAAEPPLAALPFFPDPPPPPLAEPPVPEPAVEPPLLAPAEPPLLVPLEPAACEPPAVVAALPAPFSPLRVEVDLSLSHANTIPAASVRKRAIVRTRESVPNLGA